MQDIHNSFLNGQRKQAINQIKEYGLYDFFSDYKSFLDDLYDNEAAYSYFSDATISYFRITNR